MTHCRRVVHGVAVVDAVGQIVTERALSWSLRPAHGALVTIRVVCFQTGLSLRRQSMHTRDTLGVSALQQIFLGALGEARHSYARLDLRPASLGHRTAFHALDATVPLHG